MVVLNIIQNYRYIVDEAGDHRLNEILIIVGHGSEISEINLAVLSRGHHNSLLGF
jgi:hypothetical protein